MASQAILWNVMVIIDGSLVVDRVVGEIVVEAEEGAARIADITLRLLPGADVDVPSWTGKSVIVRHVDLTPGSPYRYVARDLFTGVVDLPSVDIGRRLLNLRCTDDLRGRLGALTKAEADTLIGGKWSDAVFLRRHRATFTLRTAFLPYPPALIFRLSEICA